MLKAIVADRLIDGTGAEPLPEPIVIIRDGRIEAIHSRALAEVRLNEEVEVIECPERTILPGLIDSHVHLAFSGEPTSAAIRWTLAQEGEATLALRTLANAQAALRGGITTVQDCGARGFVVARVRDAIQDGLAVGPRILASGMPVTTTAGHLHWCGLEADGVEEVRKTVRWLVKSGADFIKVMATGGRMTPGSNIYRAQYTVEELRTIVEEAHRLERRVVGHVLGTEGICNAVEAGLDALEHCRWEGMEGSGSGYDRTWAERIAAQGICVDNNLSLEMAGIISSPEPKKELERLHSELSYLRDMKELGVKMVLCTDAGTSNVPFDHLPLAAEAGVRLLDMSPMEALLACTSLPAQELGLEGEIGSVEPGKRADLILVEGNPLEDVRNLACLDKVFKDGIEVVSQGRLYLAVR